LLVPSRRGWHNRAVTETPALATFSVKPTLTGEKVILRPFILDQDLDGIKEMLQDPEALKLTGSIHDPGRLPRWDVAAETRASGWYGSRNDQPDRLDLAITDRGTGQFVGEVVFNDWNAANRSCNFRVMIGPRGRDRGFGTEAIRMFIGYGFEQLGLHRISLDVLAFNPRASRVYQKVGFVTEGVLRQEHRWGDQWVDATIMSILDHEWERHRGRP
jgi:RimJ/RimL family protein N-acetyltransferase